MKKKDLILAALCLALALALCSCSCAPNKTEIPDGGNAPDETVPDDKVVDVAGDGAEEGEKTPEGQSGGEKDETPSGPRDLNLDDDPELAPPDYEKESDRRVKIVVDDGPFEDGPEVFLELDGYEFYFEKVQSEHTYVSVDGGPFITVREALMEGAVSLNELRLEGLDINARPVEEVKTELSFDVTVVHTDEGFLLGVVRIGDEDVSLIVYAENTDRFIPGNVIPVNYTKDQLVECDEEIPYMIENEGEEPVEVKFKAEYKILDAEIYV